MRNKHLFDFISPLSVSILLFILGIGLYFNTFHIKYFHYDDRITLAYNPYITDISNIKQIWVNFNTRFLVGLSFAFNYWLSGLDVFRFRLLNVLFHIGTASLVYQFVSLTLTLPHFTNTKLRSAVPLISLFSSLLFLVHPIQTEPINFITQRFVLMATFFYLLSLILYIKSQQQQSKTLYVLTLLTIISAMFCKEITITLPIMILLYDFFFLREFSRPTIRKILMYIPILITLGIIPFTLQHTSTLTLPTARVASVANNENPLSYAEGGTHNVDITVAGGNVLKRSEYFFTEINVLVTYLRLFLFPVNQNLAYDYPTARTYFETATILKSLILLILIIAAAALFKSHRLYSFGILWFFLTLSVESSIFPIGHVIAEYRLYLPMVGFCLLLPFLIFEITNRKTPTNIFIPLMVIILGILFFATWSRNNVWKNEITLWRDVVNKSPNLAKGHTNLGIAYLNNQQNEEAIHSSLRAIELDNKNLTAVLTIAFAKFNQKNIAEAMDIFKQVIQVEPNNAMAHLGIARCFRSLNELGPAVEHYKKALSINHTLKEAYVDLGKIFSVTVK